MLVKKVLITLGMSVTALAAFMAPNPAAAEDPVFYTIVVQGGGGSKGLERLQFFYESLMKELQVEELGEANVGCDECKNLTQDPAETALTFFVEPDGLSVLAFALSYHRTQSQFDIRSEDFRLTIDGMPPRAETECPTSPPGCTARPICAQTGYCDRPYGGACKACSP